VTTFSRHCNQDWISANHVTWQPWDGRNPFPPVEELITSRFTIVANDNITEELKTAIRGEGKVWRNYAQPLFDRAQESRYLLVVVGGAVRDIILGRTEVIRDLDLCGNVPPGLFCHWIREIALETDSNLTAHVSSNLVCHVREVAASGATIPVLEYAMLKHGKAIGPDGDRVWVGSDDLQLDYRTRDLLQNSLMFCPYISKGSLLCGLTNVEDVCSDDRLNLAQFRLNLRPIKVSPDHPPGWAHTNQVSRLLKTFDRMALRDECQNRICLTPIANYLISAFAMVKSDITILSRKFCLPEAMVLGSALRDGLKRDFGEANRTFKLLYHVLDGVASDDGPGKLELLHLMNDAFMTVSDVWNARIDLVGDGLGPPALSGDHYKVSAGAYSIADTPVGYEFSPRFVRTKLGSLVSGPNWKVIALRGVVGQETIERLYRAHSDGKYILVEYRDDRPLEAEAGLPGQEELKL